MAFNHNTYVKLTQKSGRSPFRNLFVLFSEKLSDKKSKFFLVTFLVTLLFLTTDFLLFASTSFPVFVLYSLSPSKPQKSTLRIFFNHADEEMWSPTLFTHKTFSKSQGPVFCQTCKEILEKKKKKRKKKVKTSDTRAINQIFFSLPPFAFQDQADFRQREHKICNQKQTNEQITGLKGENG